MTLKHGILSLLLSVTMSMAAVAGNIAGEFKPLYSQAQRDSVARELSAALSKATTSKDSLPLLLNLMDVSRREMQVPLSMELYNTACNAGREDLALYSLRVSANQSLHNDSLLNVLLNTARRMPDSPDQRETVAFINICLARYANRGFSNSQRVEAVSEIIKRFKTNPPTDYYQEIQLLNEIAIYLVNSASFDHVNQYLERALALADSVERTSDVLRNTTLNSMAMLNVRNLNPSTTISANKKLLELIDSLEQRYRSQGRVYKHYNMLRFTSLRRLLSKYEKLSEAEVDSIYAEINRLAKNDIDVYNAIKDQPSPAGYHFMKKGQYARALPLLRACYSKGNDSYLNLVYLPSIIKAATMSGDKEALLEFYPHYVDLLKEYISLQNNGKYIELETLYNISALRNENSKLRTSGRSDREGYHRTLILIALIVVPLLVILIALLGVLFYRSRKMSRKLAYNNECLQAETNNLMEAKHELIVARDKARQADQHKTEFINNMSHEILAPLEAVAEYSQLIVDCVDEDKKVYLRKFADVISLNVDLVSTLVNDILEIGRLESPKFQLTLRPYSLRQIVDTAVGATSHIVKPGVDFIITNKLQMSDELLITDNHRVEQVLINLLQNAAKFTDEGSITLDYELNGDKSEITFSVTDTGAGVPKAKAARIFDRFEKADPSSVGSGLGLSICATIARLLKGRVWLDETYNDGARFYFSIPIK